MSEAHEHNWHALGPSDETGVAYRCYVEVTYPDGTKGTCGASKFVRSERCTCTDNGFHVTGNPFQPFRANREIWQGRCSACGLLTADADDDY